MTIKQLIELLERNSEAAVNIMLPSFDFVPQHFHITEVGRVQKSFIDCGGTMRESVSCLLQVWTAHDIEHRLVAGKLSKILILAAKMFRSVDETFSLDNIPLEIEYGDDVASQYTVDAVDVLPDVLPSEFVFILSGKKTDCLAKDKCGVSNCC